MSLMSALGWVARTVLINGSSTGLTPPPRGAPRRASRRRTPAPPVMPGVVAGDGGAAGNGAAAVLAGDGEDAGRAAAGVPAGAGVSAAGAGPGTPGAAAGRDVTRRGFAAWRATPASCPEAGDSPCSGADWVTSAAAVPVVATSPATCAPVVRPGLYSIGAGQDGPPVAAQGRR